MNHSNVNGMTPLHDAIVRGSPDIIEELLLAGADSTCVASAGYNFSSSHLFSYFK